MTEGERRSYRRLQRIAKQEGKPKPKKPLAASKPGEAPRRGPEDLIRKFTYYVYDDSTDSVVVGAAKLGNVAADDGTPEAIEQGGTTRLTYGQNKGKRVYMAARPHLTPAYLKHLPQLPGRFRGRFGEPTSSRRLPVRSLNLLCSDLTGSGRLRNLLKGFNNVTRKRPSCR